MHQDDWIFNDFKKATFKLSAPPEEEWLHYKSIMSKVSYKKGEFLIKPGDRCDRYFFIGKGLIKRFFTTPKGSEFITSFDAEGRFVTDFANYIKGTPANLFIQALEDCELLTTCFGVIEKIRPRDIEWEIAGRRITEIRYLEKADREYEFLHLEAKDRYKKFIKEKKDIVSRLSQKDIAAYLGIAPTTLNRLIKGSS